MTTFSVLSEIANRRALTVVESLSDLEVHEARLVLSVADALIVAESESESESEETRQEKIQRSLAPILGMLSHVVLPRRKHQPFSHQRVKNELAEE